MGTQHGSPGQVKGVVNDLGTVDHRDVLGEGRNGVSGHPQVGCIGVCGGDTGLTYLVFDGELVEELVPVLLVVVDAEVPTNIQVQQEPVRAAHLEPVIGVWEGERSSAPPHTSAPLGEPNLHWGTGVATRPLAASPGRTHRT